MTRILLKKEPLLDAKREAFHHQIDALRAIRDLDYAAIFHEQGLGKTKIAIDLMLYWLERKVVDTVIVVAKKGLVDNWKREVAQHSYLTPLILSQNRAQNFYVFNSPARLILTHYEAIKAEKSRLRLFLRAREVSVILDESTKIKNPESDLTRTFHDLAPLFRKRVIMTGTPVANRPYDIWAQIYFLDQGRALGIDFDLFKRHLDLSNRLSEDLEGRGRLETALLGIQEKIGHFSVRKTKRSGVIELPNKVIKSVLADWEENQLDLYQQIRDNMRAVVVREGIPSEDRADDLLKRLLRLVQVASNPRLVDQSYSARPGKMDYLIDLLDDIRAKNERCIVWTVFTENADWLQNELRTYNCRKVHGKMAIEERNKAIAQFLRDREIMILVATPGAAKEGLTLTVANHVIFYDRSFSLDDYLQAQDRIHRISQEKTCYVYNLIMQDSIDEWIEELLHAKELAAQLAQGDISLDYYKTQMTYEFGDILRRILNIEDNKDR